MPVKPNIPAELRPHLVPIDSIKPWPGNPRTGDLDDITDSLKEGGQWRLAVVQKSTGQICVGNNMWLAAKERLKWPSLAALLLDLTDDQAKRMLARDNRSSDKGTYDTSLLADFLSELADTELGLDGTGYADEDLDDLIKTTGDMAEDTASFLATFTSPDNATAAGTTAGGPPPVANPFPVTGAPQQPAAPDGIPAPAPAPDDTAPGGEPAPNPVHTGPATYQGPGAPSPAGESAALPDAPPLATVQWVVTVEQRDTIRNALKLAQKTGGHDNASAALTAIAAYYLDRVAAPEPAAAEAGV